MGLRFDPVGGGQFKQALQQIIEVERQPVKKLEAKKDVQEKRMKLFQDFKSKFTGFDSALSEMSSLTKFREFKVDLGNGEKLMDVTVDKDHAQPGSYMVQIDQLAARSSMISNKFEDPDEKTLGIGFVVVYLPDGESFEVFVDEKDSSLHGVANLINKVPNSPIQASVIKDVYDPDEPWKLILTSKNDGEYRGVEFPEFYFLDGTKDFWIDDDRDGKNAALLIDGFEIESESNSVPNFLQGINVHLKEAAPEKPFMMTITEDYEKISVKMKELVNQVNEVLKFINKQNAVDKDTDTKVTFTGDTGLQGIEYRMRNLLHEAFPVGDVESGEYRLVWLHQVGLEFGKDGLLKFNDEKFQNVMESDFNSLAEAVTGEYGFVYQLKELIGGYSKPLTGMLSLRENGLRSRIQQIDRQISDKERMIDQKVTALTRKFSKLESSLGALQQQQQYLTASLGAGSGGNLVSQLLS